VTLEGAFLRHQQQADRILEKAARLGLKLLPVIEEEKPAKIEKKLRVRLPESYRAFLTRVKNSGESDDLHQRGPYDGIYSIRSRKSLQMNQELYSFLEFGNNAKYKTATPP